MKKGAIVTSILASVILLFLLYIIYVKQPSGVKLKLLKKNENDNENNNNNIDFIEGIYYYKQHCTILNVDIMNNNNNDFLPFGCFELTHPLVNKHQNDVVNTIPDLTQLFFILKNLKKRPVKQIIKIFKVLFDQKNEMWYISMHDNIIATYVGAPQIVKNNVKKNSPPSLIETGWNVPILNNKNLEVSVFGNPPTKISSEIDLSSSSSTALYNKLRSDTNLDKSPFMNDLKQKPQTIIIIGFCTLYWMYIRYYQIPATRVGISYNSIFEQNEYWRIFTASFAHIAFFHILMNMASLYSIGNVEFIIGPVLYFNYTFIMLIGSMMISLAIQHYLIYRRNLEQYRVVFGVGFSCILFGWLVIYANTQSVYCPIPILPQLFGKLCFPTWTFIDVGAIDLKLNLGPFVLLGFIQIFLPRASFIGHLSGILIGILVSSGIFRFINITSLMLILIYLYAWYFDHDYNNNNNNNNNNTRQNANDRLSNQIRNNVDGSTSILNITTATSPMKKILGFRFVIALICFGFVSTSLWFEITFSSMLFILVYLHYVAPSNILSRSKYEQVIQRLEFIIFYDNCYWICHFILILENIDQIPIFYGSFTKLLMYLICLLLYVGMGFLLLRKK